MNQSKKVAVLFGGQSAEHEISINSARYIEDALLSAGFDVQLIAIDQNGIWRLAPWIDAPQPHWPMAVMLPGLGGKILVPSNPASDLNVDAIFPVLHGPNGEDGSVQGLLRLCQVPFVGCDVLSSAVCMDKIVAKKLLNAAGLPTASSLSVTPDAILTYRTVRETLGNVVFVKPANMGSSIGVSRVDSPASYDQALRLAFAYDARVLIESEVLGREIECAILSDDGLQASAPGEIIATGDQFYSYDAKYVDKDGACLMYPADVSEQVRTAIQELSIAASKALRCEGLVRVDFFLKPDGSLVINELNTLPGFTEISMYPKLWQVSGRSSSDLVKALINDAFNRFSRRAKFSSIHAEKQSATAISQ